MLWDEIGPFPIRPRILHLQSPSSFLHTVCEVNEISGSELSTIVNSLRRAGEPAKDVVSRLAEVAGGLPIGWFRSQPRLQPPHLDGTYCVECAGLGKREICRRCSAGLTLEQLPNAEHNVCLRHRTWVGKGDQQHASKAVVMAERRYRPMIARGDITAREFEDLQEIAVRWRRLLVSDGRPDYAATYTEAVKLAEVFSDLRLLTDLLSPSSTYAESYALLRSRLEALFGIECAPLVDGLWTLMRPRFLAVRETLEYGSPLSVPSAHAPREFIVGPDQIVPRPLEPFSRFLDQLRTCAGDRWREICLVSFVGRGNAIRLELSITGSQKLDFVCRNGHRIMRTPRYLLASDRTQSRGCAVCANKVVLPGWNGIDMTDPWMFREFHPTRNGVIDPRTVRRGSARVLWWLCSDEAAHEFPASPADRVRNRACPECKRGRDPTGRSARLRGLWLAHRDLAIEFDEDANGMLSSDVSPDDDRDFAWRCARSGHPFRARVCDRARSGRADCPSCRGRKAAAGISDIVTTDPLIARDWDPIRNGSSLPSDFKRTNHHKVFWVCANGHPYLESPFGRVLGLGCPECGSAGPSRVSTIAEAFPEVISHWDPSSNGSLTPQVALAHAREMHGWLCDQGHSFRSTLTDYLDAPFHRCRQCEEALLRDIRASRSPSDQISVSQAAKRKRVIKPKRSVRITDQMNRYRETHSPSLGPWTVVYGFASDRKLAPPR